MSKISIAILIAMVWALTVHAQVDVCTEVQLTTADGEHAPLWLNANKHGLSSLKTTNGYVRAGVFRSMDNDSLRHWKRGFGADMALAAEFTSTVVAQQLYADIGWKKGLLTLGAKEQHIELKNQELSSGSQTLGINARPVPGIRLSLPDYWTIPGTRGLLALKGHIFYGWTTDDGWQKDFVRSNHKRTENTRLHTKAGYFRIGKPGKLLSLEVGLEMGCQFGGKTFTFDEQGEPVVIRNEGGLTGFLRAFAPGGGEVTDTEYHNKMGNHVGSWLLRLNMEKETWSASVYSDHFFEDHSQMFFLDYDGYGSGEQWDSWEHFNWMVYNLRDIQLGLEVRLKRCRWVESLVAEYLYTKYQSGPLYHDHTRTMSDHVGGLDNYYNHYVFTGWQHWGQVMGNPLYRSPLYNENHDISVSSNRFWAWHFGVDGNPVQGLHYRFLASWQKSLGTYHSPFNEPRKNVSLLAEATYTFPQQSVLAGWNVKGAFALDRGKLLGDNSGVQLTVGRQMTIKGKNN